MLLMVVVVLGLVGGIGIWGMGPREAVEVMVYTVVYCLHLFIVVKDATLYK